MQHFVLFARFFLPVWLGPAAGTALPRLYVRGTRLRVPRHRLTESRFQTGPPPFERAQLAQVAQQFLSGTPGCTPFCRRGACASSVRPGSAAPGTDLGCGAFLHPPYGPAAVASGCRAAACPVFVAPGVMGMGKGGDEQHSAAPGFSLFLFFSRLIPV